MKHTLPFRAACAAVVLLASANAARAVFFLGAPIANWNTTSGTVTNTPTTFANNPNMEVDVNGSFIVTNATPAIQTSSFDINIVLDPTFNGGTPLLASLQINQNGFVNVPAGGNIYGWTITASIIDNDGVL